MRAVLIDLTMPISPGMPFNPDHFPPEITRYAEIDTHGWEARKLLLDSHLGTHMDAPSHFVRGGATLDGIPLEVFVGAAQVVQLPDVEDGEEISPMHLPTLTSSRVLLATGWWRESEDHDRYFQRFPYLGEEAAEVLIEAGVRLVGIDGPSIDYDGATHRLLLSRGAVIVENLVRLDSLPATCPVSVMPLPIVGGDGCPVRAIAEAPEADVGTADRGE
ncbi:MAG: cyclase family protein [Solirubrobacterales bacterium]